MKRFFTLAFALLFASNIFAQNNNTEDHALIPLEYRDYKFRNDEPDYKVFEDKVVVKGFVFNEPTQKLYVLDDKNNIIVYDCKNALNKDVPKTSYHLDFTPETNCNTIDVSPNGQLLAFMDISGKSLHIINSTDGSKVTTCIIENGLTNLSKEDLILSPIKANEHIGNPFRFISDNEILIAGSDEAVLYDVTNNLAKTLSYGAKNGKAPKTFVTTSGKIIGCALRKPSKKTYDFNWINIVLIIEDGKKVKVFENQPDIDDAHNRNNINNNGNNYRFGNFRGNKTDNYKWYNKYLGAVNDPLYLLSFKECKEIAWLQDYKIMIIQYDNKIALYNHTLTDNELYKQNLLRIIDINTLEAYEDYITNNPQSPYLYIANQLYANNQWQKLSNPNDLTAKHIKDIEDFIGKYSTIISTDAAQNEIANVYKNAFNRIGDRDVAQFKSYIATYPKSPYINEAQDKINNAYKLLYADACAANTSQKFSEYANAYPESPYAKEANDKIQIAKQREEKERQIAQEREEKARKLEEQRQRERAAEESMYRTAKLGNNKDIDKYIKTYPNGRFIAEVRQLKELANSKSWKLGNSVCNCNDDGIIMVTIDQWNEDHSAFKGIVTASPGGLYQGNLLQKGNQLWIEPDGWHKCTENEKQIALEDDKSAEASALMKNKNMPFPRGSRVYRVYTSRGLLFSYSYKVVGKVDDWNDDFTKMRLQIVSTDGAEGLDGERIYEGKYIWTSPIGWSKE